MSTHDFLDQIIRAEKSMPIKNNVLNDHLICLNKARESLDIETDVSVKEQTALYVFAPCLAAFALSIHNKAQQMDSPLMLGIMREGRLLSDSMNKIFNYPKQELWLNRDVALRAAFSAGDDEALLNWLVRTRTHPLSKRQAVEILFDEKSTASTDELTLSSAEALIERWRHNGQLDRLREKEAETRKRFMLHWDDITKQTDKEIFLMDFAHSGNIQRSLRTILQYEGRVDRTHGINFLTTPGVKWATQKGSSIFGFIAEAGQPEWLSTAYIRTPELIEIFTTSPVGTLAGFDVSGHPIMSKTINNIEQKNWTESVRSKVLDAAKHYVDFFKSDIPVDIAQLVWGRFLMKPTFYEAEAFSNWKLDVGTDKYQPRILIPECNDIDTNDSSKKNVPWPAGLNVMNLHKS